MPKTQFERDLNYLTALAIFKGIRRKGVLSESELVKIASFLAGKFSPSPVVKTPEIA